MVETYEEELEDWYWNHQATNLTEWLCVNRVLGPDQLGMVCDHWPTQSLSIQSIRSDERLTLETSVNVSFTASITLINTQLIHQFDIQCPFVKFKPAPPTDCFHETIPEKQDEDEGREDSDSEKIKRLVRKQADEQAESRENDRKRDGNGASRADKNGRGKTNGKNEKKDITSDENNDKEDPDKIERLIRAQAERQAKRAGNTRKSPGRLGKEKRDELKRRLQNIDDPLRLRREIRKIRLNELDEGDYSPVELREDEGIDSVPEDIREEYRRRQYERMEDLEELQHELRLRAFEHDEFEGPEWVRLREFRRQFVEDTEDIRDPRELRKRIQDLDALSAIFGRPDRHRLGGRDELWTMMIKCVMFVIDWTLRASEHCGGSPMLRKHSYGHNFSPFTPNT